MCLIVFAWRPGHAQPLVLAANRDEFYRRPALPLGPWPAEPAHAGRIHAGRIHAGRIHAGRIHAGRIHAGRIHAGRIHAGRDLQAGGTWLGVGPHGRFAALTNIRDPAQPTGRRSRGELPVQFLADTATPSAFLEDLALRLGQYAGFNLLLGTPQELWHFNSRSAEPTRLAPGLYGVSNAGLDTPWPKLRRAKAALAERLAGVDSEALLALLRDPTPAADAELPDTGVASATERLLSSIFIAGESYGTRASTALIKDAGGGVEVVERRFGAFGTPLGEVRLRL